MSTPDSLVSHAPERRAIIGVGTDEITWLTSPVMEGLGTCDVRAWRERYRRIWLISPHPEDEVLALGGALACLSKAQADLCIVLVTNGEASHSGSACWTRERLAEERPLEMRRGLDALHVEARVVQFGLPDGQIGAHRADLLRRMAEMIEENDLIVTSCRFDGHPDHEACGDVAEMVGTLTGAQVYEYPLWMWHWAAPDEATIPWSRARRLPIPSCTVDRKRKAIAAFVSQVTSDGVREAALPACMLPRFLRPFEIVFA